MGFRPLADDPLRNFKFKVEISPGNIRAGFSKVSGLKETSEVVDYREGTDPARPRKLFGQVSFDAVTLERGLTNDNGFVTWRQQIIDVLLSAGASGSPDAIGQPSGESLGDGDPRRLVTITLGEYHGRGTWSWGLSNAWPSSLEVGEFSGDGNDVVIETVELQHEGISRNMGLTERNAT